MEDRTRETTLILVRHGESKWNAEGRAQGHRDSPLTARGRAQTRRIAERLARPEIAAVCASDLGRARETGAAIAARHGLPVDTREHLRERSYGVLEGKTMEEAARECRGWFEEWRADRLRLAPPEGETQPEMSRRVMAALSAIAADHLGETVAVATHGGPIKSAVFHILQVPVSSWDRTFVANGSITILRGTREMLRVVVFNDTCHLESESPRAGEIEN